MKFKLVYGNHDGKRYAPHSELFDNLQLIQFGLNAAGHEVDLEYDVSPGKTNIIMECFTYDFLEQMMQAAKVPHTDFIILATEFLTGDTFNDFGIDDEGQTPDIWKKRYITFSRALEISSAIWTYLPDQVVSYKQKFPSLPVGIFPHGYDKRFQRIRHRAPEDKDIDIFFSGRLSPYRKELLKSFEERGLVVVSIPTFSSSLVRDDLTSRAKIAVNLKQREEWHFPSASRYHYHLCNISPIVSESSDKHNELSPFVKEIKVEELCDSLESLLANREYMDYAQTQHEAFASEMKLAPLVEQLLDLTMGHPS